jgi:hypothetical protein
MTHATVNKVGHPRNEEENHTRYIAVDIHIADLRDPGTLLELNNAAVPDVNQLDARKADWLLDHSVLARVAVVNGSAAGLVVVLPDTVALDSDYLGWFQERYQGFLYIDRVIVTPETRHHGIATRLYREVDDLALAREQAIASDAYCQPPNVASLAFHQKMGYLEVGRQFSASEGKTVCKLMKRGGDCVKTLTRARLTVDK